MGGEKVGPLSVESLTPRTSTYSTLRYELWKLETPRETPDKIKIRRFLTEWDLWDEHPDERSMGCRASRRVARGSPRRAP